MVSPRFLVLSLAAVLECAGVAACSGSSGGVFQPTPIDSGSPAQEVDAALLATDASSLLPDSGPCPPAPVTNFTPTWKPPIAFKSGACSTTQMSDFFDACLGSSSSTQTCNTFVGANAACASCLQSDETDPQYGPIVWHSSRTYYTTNIAGCIANEQADAGGASCGAGYQAVIQCKETACSACLSAQSPDFARYSACESQAGSSECESYIQTLSTECGSVLKDTTSPVAACLPPSGDTAEQAYLALAPIFCGK